MKETNTRVLGAFKVVYTNAHTTPPKGIKTKIRCLIGANSTDISQCRSTKLGEFSSKAPIFKNADQQLEPGLL